MSVLVDRANGGVALGVVRSLGKKGIECCAHFVPLHSSLFARKYLGYKQGDYPVTEKVCESLVRLPVYPQLTKEDMEYISSAIEDVISYI